RDIVGDRLQSLEIKSRIWGAQEYLTKNSIDLLLLDLNLSGKDGFELLQSFLAEAFDTIVISAYRDKAIEAFEYGVLDFVPKPYERERLAKAIERYWGKLAQRDHTTQKIAIKKQGKIRLIEVDEIRYIQGANIYTELHLRGDGRELSNKSLEALSRLLPSHFERVHKSFIVDMNVCNEIVLLPGSQYRLQLDEGELIPLGRTRYKEIRDRYFSS
ncbi:MAG: LytTR family transcriptional regulator DNA-binding domain-containing protein, partial [Bacteroidota bacterium]